MAKPSLTLSMCLKRAQYVHPCITTEYALTSIQSHTGLYLAARLFKVLEYFEISDKVWKRPGFMPRDALTPKQLLNITMDSASNNDVLAKELAILMPGVFGGMKARIRCMDHVVNIAAQRAMKMFDATPQELTKAVNEAIGDLEQMGDDISKLKKTFVDDEIDDTQERPADDDIEVALGGTFEGMSEEEKEELRQQVEPMRDSISKVRK